MKKKIDAGQLACMIMLELYALICLLPFILIIIVSFSSEKSVIINGYSFFPKEWSLGAYRVLFSKNSSLFQGYKITTLVTIVGTFLASLITYLAGYALANRKLKYSNQFALYFFIPMIFSAGIVPWYMISKAIGAYNNVLALIIPSLVFNPFNLFLVRNFVRGMPYELEESARIDGAGDVRIAFEIYLPLAKPVIATIVLFYALGYWNNYYNALMLVENTKLFPLQMLLLKIQSEITALSRVASGVAKNPPKETFKMATSVMVMGPIVALYPFLQKYFVKGMIVGAVKG